MNSNFPWLNSLHSNISMHILHTVHQIFLKVLKENLFGSRILDWGGCFSSYHSNRIKIERKGNAHEGTLLAHRDRNHRNDEESIILYWFLCKVVNNVAVETDFPCVPIICKSEGGEWGGGGKGAYLRGELVWHYDPVSGYLFGGGGGLCFLQRGRLFAKLLVELGQWVLTHSLCFFQEKLTIESGT